MPQVQKLSKPVAGGTSGIGESTLKQFYRQTTNPRVYLVGRYPGLIQQCAAQDSNAG